MTSSLQDATFVPHSHSPYGKEGSGFYSKHTRICYDVINMASPTVLEALDKVTLQGHDPFVICDFGTADGGGSIFLITRCIERIKEKYGTEQEVVVVYEDQATNDFKSLVGRIHGLVPGSPTYVSKYGHVNVLFSATNFYSPCLPKGWLHLGISSCAMHWLKSRPCTLSKAIHHTTGAVTDSERRKFREQAARDWEIILLARAHELAPGGQLVVIGFCVDDLGQSSGNTRRIKNSGRERMTSLWLGMVQDGKITKEEFEQTTFNSYHRTVDEYAAPFSDKTSAVHKAGLRLVSIETKIVPCHFYQKWMQETSKNDAAAARRHAQSYVLSTRAWSNAVFRSALADFRSDDEKDAIVDEFFKRYEDEVAAAPEDHAMDSVNAYIHISKAS